MRGIRGAITIKNDTEAEIVAAVRWMVTEMIRKNGVTPEDVGAVILSATEDITAAFPAAGARQIPGFDLVPLFDTRQMAVKESLPLCIRALVLADTDKSQREIRHIYLGEAALLRQDLVMKRPDEPEEE
ncbi:MAG: chorismate mutase [Selenomonadaceae bacterium]|nr:chorismate mutase [Selenomonadaceae bacterium]